MSNDSCHRLLVVDDDPEIRQAFEFCLEKRYEITGVPSGEKAVELVKKAMFPVVVLDLNMTGMSGIETLRRLRKINRLQKIIILTGHGDRESAIDAVNLGAFKYLLKPFRLDAIKKSVAEAFEQYLREKSTMPLEHADVAELERLGLSGRAAEVALEISRGRSNVEIAEDLGISHRTVEKHLEVIYKQLKISSRTKVVLRLRNLLPRAGSDLIGLTFFYVVAKPFLDVGLW